MFHENALSYTVSFCCFYSGSLWMTMFMIMFHCQKGVCKKVFVKVSIPEVSRVKENHLNCQNRWNTSMEATEITKDQINHPKPYNIKP